MMHWRSGLLPLALTAAACAAGTSRRTAPAPAPAPMTAAVAAGHATTGSAPQDWPVSPEDAARRNPLTATGSNLAKGEEMFNRHCTACHGVSGRGDGPVAHQWPRLPKDLTHPDRQARMTDGEIFTRITTGHREGGDEIMPGFGDKLGADDRWRLVLYVRRLGGR